LEASALGSLIAACPAWKKERKKKPIPTLFYAPIGGNLERHVGILAKVNGVSPFRHNFRVFRL